MKNDGRYAIKGLDEAEFEPGSRDRVLKNLLGIKSKREMDRVEAREQLRAMEQFIALYDQSHRFNASDICYMHKAWLGPIYSWAGQYRQVNLSKGQFPFATAMHIPNLMVDFEKGSLREFTPCNYEKREDLAKALAVVHVELVLIHPFRDGNGRLGRILATLMALQAGFPLLDFSEIRGRKKEEYFLAVQAGVGSDYGPMEAIFSKVILRTLRSRE
jgi:cell filamentation protein